MGYLSSSSAGPKGIPTRDEVLCHINTNRRELFYRQIGDVAALARIEQTTTTIASTLETQLKHSNYKLTRAATLPGKLLLGSPNTTSILFFVSIKRILLVKGFIFCCAKYELTVIYNGLRPGSNVELCMFRVNLMQMMKNSSFCSFALTSGNVKLNV